MPDRAKFDAILRHISLGGLVQDACKANGIHRDTLNAWNAADPELSDLYARARVNQAHALAEQVIAIADDPKIEPEHKRVQVDARKWFTSKIAPRLYGERTQVDVLHGLDDSLTALLAGAFTGTAPLSIVEAEPIRIIEQPLAAPDDNT